MTLFIDMNTFSSKFPRNLKHTFCLSYTFSKIKKSKEVYALSSQLWITVVITFCMEGPSSCVVVSYTIYKAAWKM